MQVDKLWAQVPYNLSAQTIVGIQNVILGSCDPSDDTPTSTLLNFTQLPANDAFGGHPRQFRGANTPSGALQVRGLRPSHQQQGAWNPLLTVRA